MNLNSREQKIHSAFNFSIFLKGVHATIEIIGGIVLVFITKAYIVSRVLSITQEELSKDPKDVIAHYLISVSNNFTVSSQHFAALYLFIHGLIQLVLVAGLLKKKLWAYPTSILVFSLFIIYQIYRFSHTHSIWLLVFTIFDIIIIWLTLHEYRQIKSITQSS